MTYCAVLRALDGRRTRDHHPPPRATIVLFRAYSSPLVRNLVHHCEDYSPPCSHHQCPTDCIHPEWHTHTVACGHLSEEEEGELARLRVGVSRGAGHELEQLRPAGRGLGLVPLALGLRQETDATRATTPFLTGLEVSVRRSTAARSSMRKGLPIINQFHLLSNPAYSHSIRPRILNLLPFVNVILNKTSEPG